MNDSVEAAGPALLAPPQVPQYALFDARAVTLATFLGTPAAGAVLMAINYRRVGQKGQAIWTLAFGILLAAAGVFVAYLFPVWSIPIGIGLLLLTAVAARKMQGPAIELHKALGGPLDSLWAAAAVGLALMVVVLAGVATPILLNGAKTKVVIGNKDEVFFSGTATKADALALGDAFKKIGYFQDKGTSVFLDKSTAGSSGTGAETTVSLVQRDGVWDQPEMLANSEEVVREIAYSIGGFPVTVKLIDASENVKKSGVIGRVVIGTKDEIFYEGTATAGDAQALGEALKADKYLQDKGTSVLLSKDGRGTVLSFVVADGIWDDAANVAEFEAITRAVANAVGGLPISVRLVSTTLDNKREILVK